MRVPLSTKIPAKLGCLESLLFVEKRFGTCSWNACSSYSKYPLVYKQSSFKYRVKHVNIRIR